MNPKVILGVRIVFGLAILFFGCNKLFYFMDPPAPSTKIASSFLKVLISSKTMMLVAIVEICSGIALLANRFAPLMMVVLMSVSVNAFLYHIKLDIKNWYIGVAFLGLNILMLYIYKDRYKELLKPQ
ncbi:DoxX family membrane protein [Aquimarina gracilis]|uniref:DoxX family membrane protein n=1 Tax=Aquimarina gracilis TaxID=874422 RepID=A0ABU5ZPE8_9FLAO|nr:DoxX family membrane protein [Aquimarina gracilis]MEB3343992.1 DoxX family membrane protein [Aquimarina gracilis]